MQEEEKVIAEVQPEPEAPVEAPADLGVEVSEEVKSTDVFGG